MDREVVCLLDDFVTRQQRYWVKVYNNGITAFEERRDANIYPYAQRDERSSEAFVVRRGGLAGFAVTKRGKGAHVGKPYEVA